MENITMNPFVHLSADFRLPRYSELPNMGLYLEQVVKYINGFITPIGCSEITASMVSNYVKKGLIAPPLKKQYHAEQIAYLIFIAAGKNVLSIESIASLFRMQRATYDSPTAYDYFCCELENMLRFVTGRSQEVRKIGKRNSEEKTILRSVIIALAHMLYVNAALEVMGKIEESSGRSEL